MVFLITQNSANISLYKLKVEVDFPTRSTAKDEASEDQAGVVFRSVKISTNFPFTSILISESTSHYSCYQNLSNGIDDY